MKNKTAYILGIALVLSMSSCGGDNGKADGYGNFEATEITISAENNGKLMQFNVKEGDLLEKGTLLGLYRYHSPIPETGTIVILQSCGLLPIQKCIVPNFRFKCKT